MRFLPLLLLLFFAATPLYAQQGPGAHIGVGVRVGDLINGVIFSQSGLANSATLLVPINTGGNFRIEPEIGYGRISQGDDGSEETSSLVTLGVGLLPLFPHGDGLLYVGGRLRYTRLKQTVDSDFGGGERESSQSWLGFAPVVGGEHFFSARFSLGGEAGFEYRTFGAESNGEEIEVDLSSFATIGSVYVRFYFN